MGLFVPIVGVSTAAVTSGVAATRVDGTRAATLVRSAAVLATAIFGAAVGAAALSLLLWIFHIVGKGWCCRLLSCKWTIRLRQG